MMSLLNPTVVFNYLDMLELSPEFKVEKHLVGKEKAPLLVIDNYLAKPEKLVDYAASVKYADPQGFYPGIRSQAPRAFIDLFAAALSELVLSELSIPGNKLKVFMCHYSIVTRAANELKLLQRVPHFDSLEANGLAMVYYLFKKPLGGTAFYRHKKTGFEYIDESRKLEYFKSLEAENDGPNLPKAEYINGDTPLFEQIAKQEGVFNRMLVYKRNSLHSGCIAPEYVPDPDPRSGRLTITSFIDVL